MPPQTTHTTLFSPAELSYLHTSLSASPPIRPDLRTPTDFRPVVAESTILPTANGSARVCFPDGTEAVVGIKAEVERTSRQYRPTAGTTFSDHPTEFDEGDSTQNTTWITATLDIPGHRDDDPLPTFLSSLLQESLLSSRALHPKLRLNARWHWRLFIDILLLSPPLSYPLPLLSLTVHLALLDTRLPRRVSEPEDDPLFDDDWNAAVPLYARDVDGERPPVTLLVMTAGANIIFDPIRDELAVADAVVAVSLAPGPTGAKEPPLRVVAVRVIDPPSRLTPLGIPQAASTTQTAQGGTGAVDVQGPVGVQRDRLVEKEEGAVWNPPKGGLKRELLVRILKSCTESGGVGEEVLAGLKGAGV